jgi:hypothetical protein
MTRNTQAGEPVTTPNYKEAIKSEGVTQKMTRLEMTLYVLSCEAVTMRGMCGVTRRSSENRSLSSESSVTSSAHPPSETATSALKRLKF